MNFLIKKTEWSNLEFVLIKASFISFGVLVGLYFSKPMNLYVIYIAGVCLISSVIVTYLWLNKMMDKKEVNTRQIIKPEP